MMLGRQPPAFFKVCWPFISPVYVIVSFITQLHVYHSILYPPLTNINFELGFSNNTNSNRRRLQKINIMCTTKAQYRWSGLLETRCNRM